MFSRILVGYDGSPQARKALTTALELASRLQGEVEALVLIRAPEFAELEGEVQAALKEANGPLAEAIRWANAEAARFQVPFRVQKQLGHPAESLVRIAEAEAFDLIVLGRRGRSTAARWMLGSVSERVLQYAHCPVMVIH